MNQLRKPKSAHRSAISRCALALLTGAWLSLTSCGDDDDAPKHPVANAGAGGTAGAAASTGGGSAGGAAGEGQHAAEFSLEVLKIDASGDADPASLWWNASGHYLLIADNRHNRIWKWESGTDFSIYATTSGKPADPQASATSPSRDNVGQLVELADGTVILAGCSPSVGPYRHRLRSSPRAAS